MRNFKYILSVLAALAVGLMLFGCNGSENPPSNTTDAAAGSETLTVVDGGATEYRIIYRLGSSAGSDSAKELAAAIEGMTGVAVEARSDAAKKEDHREIILGDADREAALAVTAALRTNDYTIRVAGEDIIIAGGSDEATSEAVKYFIGKYLNGKSDKLMLNKDEAYDFLAEYPVEGMTLCGVDISKYVIVIGEKANRLEKYAAEVINDRITALTGYTLDIVEDSKAGSEHGITVGKTSRSTPAHTARKYLIQAMPNGVAVCGDEYSIVTAAYTFADEYLSSGKEVSVPDAGIEREADETVYPENDILAKKNLVALCDQKNGEVAVIDLDIAMTDVDAAVVWTWKPTKALGFSNIEAFGNRVDEARIRYSEKLGSYVLLATSSSGFMGMAEFPSGRCIWEASNSSISPHSIDYLPDGNVVVAGSGVNSKGQYGCVRIYAASRSPYSTRYFEIKQTSAHGVLYDRANRCIWALGDKDICAYRLTGTPDDPSMEKISLLTTPYSKGNGHDLSVVKDDPNLMWVSGNGISQFRKSTGVITTSYNGYSTFGNVNAKCIDETADGTILRCVGSNVFAAHDTDTLNVYTEDEKGKIVSKNIVFKNRAFYKARVIDAAKLG